MLGSGSLLYGCGVVLGFDGLVVIGASAGVALALGLLAVVARPRLSVERTVTPTRVTVGRPASGRLVVRNLSRWPAPSFVAVDSVGAQPIELGVRSLGGGSRRAVEYDVPTLRRGRLALGPITIERRDPLGLVRRAQPQGGADWLWVRPRTHVVAALPVGVLIDDEGVLRADRAAGLGDVLVATGVRPRRRPPAGPLALDRADWDVDGQGARRHQPSGDHRRARCPS